MTLYERIWNELKIENAGLWFIEKVILIKAPTNVLKAILKGCKIEFVFASYEINSYSYLFSILRIHDSENHFNISAPIRFKEDIQLLLSNLSCGLVDVKLYDELNTLVISGISKNENFEINQFYKYIYSLNNIYTGQFNDSTEKIHDKLEQTSISDLYIDSSFNVFSVNPIFSELQCFDIKYVGNNEVSEFSIADSDEGKNQERQIYIALQRLFQSNVFHNPKLSEKENNREFIDVLCFYDLGIFLIESKVMGVLASKEGKSISKKTNDLQKDIRKAIKQLCGANKRITKGEEIMDSDGNIIHFNRQIIPHCIILVSEMLLFGDAKDWEEIKILIFKKMIKEKIIIHILEFAEFMTLLKYSNGRKHHFDYHLMKRSEQCVEKNSLFVKTIFKK